MFYFFSRRLGWEVRALLLRVLGLQENQRSDFRLILNELRGITSMNTQITALVTSMQSDIAKQGTVLAGVGVFLQTLSAQRAAELEAAKALGVTDEQLAAFGAVDELIKHNTETMQAFISGTAAAGEPIPEVPPTAAPTTAPAADTTAATTTGAADPAPTTTTGAADPAPATTTANGTPALADATS